MNGNGSFSKKIDLSILDPGIYFKKSEQMGKQKSS
jgi:hypothetical protein